MSSGNEISLKPCALELSIQLLSEMLIVCFSCLAKMKRRLARKSSKSLFNKPKLGITWEKLKFSSNPLTYSTKDKVTKSHEKSSISSFSLISSKLSKAKKSKRQNWGKNELFDLMTHLLEMNIQFQSCLKQHLKTRNDQAADQGHKNDNDELT